MLAIMSHTAMLALSFLSIGQVQASVPMVNEPAGREDVICFAVAIHLGQAGDDNVKSAAQLLAMYYFGRAQTQLSEPDLMTELATVAPRISGERWEIEKTRCGEGLREAGEQLARSADTISSGLAH